MKKCIHEVISTREACCNKECPMTLEEIGRRHHVSTVRAKQLVDSALLKLKKTLKRKNTI